MSPICKYLQEADRSGRERRGSNGRAMDGTSCQEAICDAWFGEVSDCGIRRA
jgi:hypothetical protein